MPVEIEVKRKYRLTEVILNKAAYSRERAAEIRKEICKACGISSNTLSRWENIECAEKEMIFADHLRTISNLLQTEMNNLFA